MGEKLDARSAEPYMRVGGKRLSSIVKKYDDVVSGKVTPVTLPPATIRKFKNKAGYSTSQGKLLVPHGAGQTVRVRGGNVVLKESSGIERVQIPCPFIRLRQYLRCMKLNAKAINKMKRANEYFGIRFYGNHRGNFYANIELLIADLEKYDAIVAPGTNIKQEEVYENLEILRIGRSATRNWEESAGANRRKRTKEYNRKRAKLQRRKLKRGPAFIRNAYQEKANERMREYRKRLKRDPRKDRHYKAQAKKRAKASQAKARKKKITPRKGRKK